MAHHEIVAEEQHTILDMEQEIIKLKAECEELRGSRDYWVDSYNRECLRTTKEAKKPDSYRKQLQKMESLWRNHLNECDPQDDNDWEAEARQILCNASDIEKKIAVDGYDETDREYVPF